MVKIGIIGGSGLDDPQLLQNYEEREIETPFGNPSSKIACAGCVTISKGINTYSSSIN